MTPEDRFFKFVRRTSGCWHWRGATTHDGYGRFVIYGHEHQASRWLYERERGEIPEGMVLRRTCENPTCVRPDHMETITEHDRQQHSRGPVAENAAKTHCAHGHLLSGDNLYVDPEGKRKCRTCARRIQDERKAKRGTTRRPKPGKRKLARELEEHTAVALGERYGVSDTTIRNWAKQHGLR